MGEGREGAEKEVEEKERRELREGELGGSKDRERRRREGVRNSRTAICFSRIQNYFSNYFLHFEILQVVRLGRGRSRNWCFHQHLKYTIKVQSSWTYPPAYPLDNS
jgi:hypothetical protein